MGLSEINEALKDNCVALVEAIEKLKEERFDDIKGQLIWCIGSYENDGNPSGLEKLGTQVLDLLIEYKNEKPRKVAKKLIENMQKALSDYQEVVTA